MEEIGKEFTSSATELEKEYILPKTVGGTRVHLLLGVKNTRIQPVLIRVLQSGVVAYRSPFKDVGGSQIIFAGFSKFFTQANKDQQRESSHAVYSVYRDKLNKSMEYNIIGELRSESISKVQISHPVTWNKLDEKDLIEDTDFISPGILY